MFRIITKSEKFLLEKRSYEFNVFCLFNLDEKQQTNQRK